MPFWRGHRGGRVRRSRDATGDDEALASRRGNLESPAVATSGTDVAGRTTARLDETSDPVILRLAPGARVNVRAVTAVDIPEYVPPPGADDGAADEAR